MTERLEKALASVSGVTGENGLNRVLLALPFANG
jgi:hypothetical protein